MTTENNKTNSPSHLAAAAMHYLGANHIFSA